MDLIERKTTEHLFKFEPDKSRRTKLVACKFPLPNNVDKHTAQLFMSWDLETTGVDVNKDKIISIGAVISVGWRGTKHGSVSTYFAKVGYFHTFVYTDTIIPDDAFKVHGISNEILNRNGVPPGPVIATPAPDLDEAVELWTKWIQWCKMSPNMSIFWGGHNVRGFDNPILYMCMHRVGIDLEKWMHKVKIVSGYDTYRLFRAWDNKDKVADEKRPRYSDTNEKLGEGKVTYKLGWVFRRWTGQAIGNAHDALYDCIMIAEIFETDTFTNCFHVTDFNNKHLWNNDKTLHEISSKIALKNKRMIAKVAETAHLPPTQTKFGLNPILVENVCVNCTTLIQGNAHLHRCNIPRAFQK